MSGRPPETQGSVTDPEPHRVSRVLLLHFRIWDGGAVWIPPGGGVKPDESAEEAAIREVQEETSVALIAPLRRVWLRRTRYFQRDVRESYFLTRLAETPAVLIESVPGGPADLLEYRWWTIAEIAEAESSVEFTPRDIARRLAPLVLDLFPPEPIEVGG